MLNLPDLVVDKIFSSVEESYNIYFDLNGPEEIPWQFENQAEVCYSIISKFYEFMLCIVSPWWRMNKLGFGVMRREICYGWLSKTPVLDITPFYDMWRLWGLSTSSQLQLAVTQLRSNTDDGDDDEGGDGVESYQEASWAEHEK